MNLEQLDLGAFERAQCDSLKRLDPDCDLYVLIACALCTQALSRGDVCVPLSKLANLRPWPEQELVLPDVATLKTLFAQSKLVGEELDFRPFVVAHDRLYINRYCAYERSLAAQLLQRAHPIDVEQTQLKESLEKLFARNTQNPDWQRLAAAQAVRSRLTVISGGPGTGKTTTVVRLLAALLEQPYGQDLAIGLAAPTGKAAARMAEAIRNAKAELPVSDAIKAALPGHARTLHRLLGAHGDSPKVRYHAQNPLALDVLVVDEASMIDLAMMAKVLDALPAHARLILLSDKDQLAAVEAGAVFAELCEGRGSDAQTAQALTELTGQAVNPAYSASRIGSHVVLLTHSHRFKSDSGIGHLARMVNEGDAKGTLKVLEMGYKDVVYNAFPDSKGLHQRIKEGYAAYLACVSKGDVANAFAAFNTFRVLTAQREGPYGVNQLNDAMEKNLKGQGRWYAGRPVMITQNDYGLGLFNGDIGLCLPTEQGLRVFFEADEGFRSFSTARLPVHEPAFAMTVHKSQGSEFSKVLMVLPEHSSPLLTRALLYTGITRAKHTIELWASQARLLEAVRTRDLRAAGLSLRLQKPTSEPLAPIAPHGEERQYSMF